MNISVLSTAKHPILAINTDESYANRLGMVIRFLPHNTARKLLFKFFITMILLVGLHGLVFRPISKTLKKAILSLAPPKTENLLIRFHTLSSRARCYCFFASPSLNLVAFGKLAFNEKNRSLLKQEVKNLKLLKKNNIFMAPTLLSISDDGNYSGFAVSPIPKSFELATKKNYFIDQALLKVLQGDIVSLSVEILQREEWWGTFQSLASSDLLSGCSALNVSQVHGDMGSENIFESSVVKKFYIIDWERASTSAPYLTDALGYWLGAYHREILSRPKKLWLLNLFHNDFISKYQCREADAVAALSYLVYVGFDLAEALADAYSSDN